MPRRVFATSCIVVLLLTACGHADTQPARPLVSRPAADLVEIRMNIRDLSENSGAAMSTTQPGILFTINDSGNDPVLFAVDTSGALRGRWVVPSATNIDWEAISMGSCGTARGAPSAGQCVYIGDVGDNNGRRRDLTIYRFPEPRVHGADSARALTVERLTLRYADGPRDVEAMYVGPPGTIYLISKRATYDVVHRMQPARVYRVLASAWSSRDTAVADLDQRIPIIPGSAPFRTITDASLSPDARHVAVRTYAEIYVFAADPSTGRILPTVAPAVCSLTDSKGAFGEGITWLGISGRFLLTSEGAKSPMLVVQCPLPAR